MKMHFIFCFYASTMRSKQSPHRMLTFFVALTLCPHLGQISLRVELGRLPPGVSAPGWAAPPAPVRIYPSVRPMWMSSPSLGEHAI